MTLSVIIPVYNEASVIAATLRFINQHNQNNEIADVIVVDGGSTDNTSMLATENGATVIASAKGRSRQMNAGGQVAKGDILYFLHADTIPPADYLHHIKAAIDEGYSLGCFRLRFDVDHWFLRANAWFTRFDINAFRFGDQSLFVTRQAFEDCGGFNEKQIMLEDQEIIGRLKRYGRFKVVDAAVTTSSRKYITNGIFKTQAVYFLIYVMYRLGVSQQRLLKLYRSMIRQDKL